MKKTQLIIVLILAFTLLCAVTAMAGQALDRILQRGELIVGTSGDQPPLTLKTKEGTIIGFDIDLAQYMAEAMGVKLRVVPMTFSELLPALASGKLDMILSGMTITPSRNLKVAYVGPYYVSGKGILTKIETLKKLKAIADDKETSFVDLINREDFSVVALQSSTSQIFAKKALPETNLVLTENLDEAVDLVIKGSVDALIADFPYCVVSAIRHQDKGLAAGEALFTYEPLGIALPPDDPLLVNWVENLLGTLKGSSSLNKLINRWFEDPSWLSQLP